VLVLVLVQMLGDRSSLLVPRAALSSSLEVITHDHKGRS
jgi:hypothetical protein